MKQMWMLIGLLMMSAHTVKAEMMPKFVPQETKLYTFSDDVLQAVEQCANYKTEFSAKETPYEHLGDFAGSSEVVSEFQIYGMKYGRCRMSVRFSALGKGETRFNCRLDDEQREALLMAMKDKSTEEYVITIPTRSEQDCSGCNEAVSFFGNMFDAMVATLKSRACVERHIQPTKDEIIEERTQKNRFADDFIAALQNCQPDAAVHETTTVKDNIQIIGPTDDEQCRLLYLGFELVLDKKQLKSITGYDDLQRLLLVNLDKARYHFEDKYSNAGLLYALAECRDKNGSYTSDENIFQRGNIQARTGIMAHREKDVCKIEIKNTIAVADIYFRDYGLMCMVSNVHWPRLLALYQHLIDEAGPENNIDKNGINYRSVGQHTPETRAADTVLFQKIREEGLCAPKTPIDPIKVEIDDFLYRDAEIRK